VKRQDFTLKGTAGPESSFTAASIARLIKEQVEAATAAAKDDLRVTAKRQTTYTVLGQELTESEAKRLYGELDRALYPPF
jgi:hypothetical protein